MARAVNSTPRRMDLKRLSPRETGKTELHVGLVPNTDKPSEWADNEEADAAALRLAPAASEDRWGVTTETGALMGEPRRPGFVPAHLRIMYIMTSLNLHQELQCHGPLISWNLSFIAGMTIQKLEYIANWPIESFIGWNSLHDFIGKCRLNALGADGHLRELMTRPIRLNGKVRVKKAD